MHSARLLLHFHTFQKQRFQIYKQGYSNKVKKCVLHRNKKYNFLGEITKNFVLYFCSE